MSLQFTPEQEELRALARKFFSEQVPPAYLRARVEGSPASDPGLWEKFSALGMFSYFADDESKAGKLLPDLGIVAFEAGRVLCPENIVDALLSGPILLSRLDEKSREVLLGAASKNWSSAAESLPRGALAILPSDSWKKIVRGKNTKEASLSGKLSSISGIFSSAYLIVCPFEARPESKSTPLALTIDGSWRKTPGIDLATSAGSADLSGAPAKPVAGADSAWLAHCWCALRANELAGMAAVAVEMTADYVKTRKQFGVPVGAFQAVQHKLADAHLKAEALRSLAAFASWSAYHSPEQFALAARSALWYGRHAAPEVIESAIQLHGGIGFTWEFDLHLYLRRAKAIEALSGFLTDTDACEALLELAV